MCGGIFKNKNCRPACAYKLGSDRSKIALSRGFYGSKIFHRETICGFYGGELNVSRKTLFHNGFLREVMISPGRNNPAMVNLVRGLMSNGLLGGQSSVYSKWDNFCLPLFIHACFLTMGYSDR